LHDLINNFASTTSKSRTNFRQPEIILEDPRCGKPEPRALHQVWPKESAVIFSHDWFAASKQRTGFVMMQAHIAELERVTGHQQGDLNLFHKTLRA
jgi:hypothetical protein